MAFERRCTAQIQQVFQDKESFVKEWQQLKRAASICPDGTCPFVPEAAFEYDPEQFLYYRARAITADTPNANGDYFPHAEIEAAYPSFIGKGVYLNHDNDNPDKAFGLLLDAVWHKSAKYVELLAAVDKELADEKHPGLLRKINSGMINSTSMSCLCAEAQCGICKNKARNIFELCDHMNPKAMGYIKGKRAASGSDICYEVNYGLTFTEDSLVYVPADPTARVMQVWSSLSKTATIAKIKEKLTEVNDFLEGIKSDNL